MCSGRQLQATDTSNEKRFWFSFFLTAAPIVYRAARDIYSAYYSKKRESLGFVGMSFKEALMVDEVMDGLGKFLEVADKEMTEHGESHSKESP